MDLLNRIHSEEFQLGVMVTVVGGLILCGIIFLLGILFASFRKFIKSLPSKIISVIKNVRSWDIFQKVFQTYEGVGTKPSLEKYKQPFHDTNKWTRRFDPTITLSIPLSDEMRLYYGVTKIEIRRLYPFNNHYEVTITHSNADKINELHAPHKGILHLIKQCYFREISENG